MPAVGMTNNRIYYVAGALAAVVLLMGGGKMVYDHSGSPIAKRAVTLSEYCQQLKEQQSMEYIDCQNSLDLSLKDLMDEGILDANKCKPNPADATTAVCPVKVWFTNKNIIVKIPGIVKPLRKVKVQLEWVREIPITKRSVGQSHFTVAPPIGQF